MSALEIVGDGGEVNLGGSFGEASSSHSAQPIAALRRVEDLLDEAADPMDRPVPGVEARKRIPLVAAQHRREHNLP